MTKWEREADNVLRKIFRELPPNATVEQAKKAASAAYPFGERAMTPYKAWLGMVRKHIHARFPEERSKYFAKELEKRGAQRRGKAQPISLSNTDDPPHELEHFQVLTGVKS